MARLQLSSNEQLVREQAKEAERAAYRRRYWQGYAKRVRRVFGSIAPDEYEAVKTRANANDRSVWGQIWAESKAYCRGAVLPSPEIENRQHRLVTELRRIGNNINQLAKLGHVRARKHGGLVSREGYKIGAETVRQMEKLEAMITDLGRTKNRSGERDDH